MPHPEEPSPNKKAVEEAVGELPFGKVIYGFFIREGKAVKQGWLAVLIIGGGLLWFGNEHGSRSADKEVAKMQGELDDAKRDRDKFQIQMTQAQDALAPWKELANSQYPGEPINKSLNLLLQKVDALQKAMQNVATDPLQEPIASASATVTVDLLTDKPDPVGNNMGQGGVVQLTSPTTPLLTATTINNTSFKADAGHGKYRIVGVCAIDDPYMGKPIAKLSDATFMLVGFAKGLLPPNTQIIGGQIVWVINNRITLKFDIPPQASIQDTGNDSIVLIRVFDIQAGLQPLRH